MICKPVKMPRRVYLTESETAIEMPVSFIEQDVTSLELLKNNPNCALEVRHALAVRLYNL